MSEPLSKVVIKFANGTYFYNYIGRGTDINEAWTFNRKEGAQNTINSNGLTDCVIVPVTVEFINHKTKGTNA